MFAMVLSFGLVLTALKSRKARSWRYGTGIDFQDLYEIMQEKEYLHSHNVSETSPLIV